MKNISDWVRRYPIIAFYLITFAITWGLGYSYIAVFKHHLDYLIFLASIATCGPALAGIIVNFLENQAPKTGNKNTRWITFLIAFLIGSVVFNATNFLINKAPFSIATIIAVSLLIVPPVAYVVSAAFSRVPAIRSYLNTLVNPHGVMGWLLIALVFIPSLILLSFPILHLLGYPADFSISFSASGFPLLGLIVLKFLYQLLFYNATGEEAGWSGFARHRLQAQMSPLITALIVTLFWVPWHAFLWYAEGQDVFSINFWMTSYINHLPVSIILTWLYNRGKGSILVASIGHAAANTVGGVLGNIDPLGFYLVMYGGVALVILIDKMWRKLPAEHPAVFSETQVVSP